MNFLYDDYVKEKSCYMFYFLENKGNFKWFITFCDYLFAMFLVRFFTYLSMKLHSIFTSVLNSFCTFS